MIFALVNTAFETQMYENSAFLCIPKITVNWDRLYLLFVFYEAQNQLSNVSPNFFPVNAASERKTFVHKSGQGLETLLQSLQVSSLLSCHSAPSYMSIGVVNTGAFYF